jgi:hypothetical protein
MPKLTLTNAHGTFTCEPYDLDRAIATLLPASVSDLRAELEDSNPDIDYSDIHYVSEALMMIAGH